MAIEVGTVTHNGHEFSALGACYDGERATGYLAGDEKTGIVWMQSWHGERIGTARIVSSWKTPRSHVASRMFQIEATIDGVKYTGRGCGVGMLWSGKRKAK